MDDERRPRRVGPPERPGALGGKRDLNRKKRVQDLVEAGLHLFLQGGIEGVTIDEVAREAGMAKGNFYRYFRDKADLVEAVVEPVTVAVRTAIRECDDMLRDAEGREDTVAAYRQLGARLIATLAAHPDATCVYLQERRAPATAARQAISELAAELDDRAIALSETAVERGLLSVRDPRVSALAVSGAVEALALASLRNQFPLDPLETANTLIGLVLDGIRNT
ncbi:MAG: TetR/AcrR family transcriptional regulator [Myxococcota bacterium]